MQIDLEKVSIHLALVPALEVRGIDQEALKGIARVPLMHHLLRELDSGEKLFGGVGFIEDRRRIVFEFMDCTDGTRIIRDAWEGLPPWEET